MRNTEMNKICKLRKRIFLAYYYISSPNLAIFSNFNMLAPTVAKDFAFLAKIKIQFKRGWSNVENKLDEKIHAFLQDDI